MIKGIQVVGLLVGAYLIIQTILNFRKGRVGIWRTLFFLALWSGMIALFMDTGLVSLALPFLDMQQAILAVLVMGVLTSFVLIIQIYQQIISLDRRMTELVQNLAIHDYVKEASATGKED